MRIETERLILRAIKEEDAKDLYAYRSDAETNRYQGWIAKSMGDAKAFIRGVAADPNIPDTWYQLIIIDRGLNESIGDIGIHFLNNPEEVEIGFTLRKGSHGKGFASEAVKAVIEYIFTEFSKQKIIACVLPENSGSIALLEKLGFSEEEKVDGELQYGLYYKC